MIQRGDLAQAIKKKKDTSLKFDNQIIFVWLCEIIEGLEHLHSMRIIHRDIKPAYIIIIILMFNQFGYQFYFNEY